MTRVELPVKVNTRRPLLVRLGNETLLPADFPVGKRPKHANRKTHKRDSDEARVYPNGTINLGKPPGVQPVKLKARV